jgi:Flp pilus assembly protein TadG
MGVKKMKTIYRENGVVMVVAALMIVALMLSAAIVIDVGQMYMVKARLQTAADAAAMAGAQSLIENNQNAGLATDESRQYVSRNLNPPYDYTPTVNPGNSQSTFTATVSQQVGFYFMPVVGIHGQRLTASATAVAQVVAALNGIVPFGVEQQQLIFKEPYILKYGAGPHETEYQRHGGNFGALALGGNGANRYRDNIKYGYQGLIRIGDLVTTEPGNMAGPTDQGVSYRKTLCTKGCSALTQIEANCPRVVIVPVIDALPSGGRGQATVLGFAAFFLEDTVDSASKGQKDVIGRFLRWTGDGPGGQGNDFGVVTATLIR